MAGSFRVSDQASGATRSHRQGKTPMTIALGRARVPQSLSSAKWVTGKMKVDLAKL